MAEWLLKSAAGVAIGATILCNVSTWFIPKAQQLSLAYIKQVQLQTLDKQRSTFNAAEDLSTLKPELDARNIPLYAVVHESLGVDEFRPFFKGDIFIDLERKFYGPKERWLNIPSLFSFQSLKAVYKAVVVRGTPGNLKGEGRILGATFVIGPGDQGIVYEHFESVAGDEANIEDVRAALQKLK